MAESDLFAAADASRCDRAVFLLLLIYLYEELLRPPLRLLRPGRSVPDDLPDPGQPRRR